MIRVLIMIAVAGFLVSVVTLSAAVGIAGPNNILHGAWSWGPNGWGGHWSGHNHFSFDRSDEDGPQTTREIAWSGGDAVDVDVDADVQYTQAPGPAKVTVSGPRDAVADVDIDDGHIRYKPENEHDAHLTIVMSSPSIDHFTMESSGKLAIANYKQDKLNLDLQGDADVVAAGEAKAVELSISGSANADLAAVKAHSAHVDIDGSGDATLAPTEAADITISGSGDVTLLTRPANMRSNVSGSGRVVQKEAPPPSA